MTVPIQAIRIEAEWNGTAISARHWITVHLLDKADHLEIRVSAPYYGSPQAPSTPVGPTDQLWEHEVVEIFIYGENEHYLEIELAPSGHHLVLQLRGIRNVIASKLPLDFTATIHGDRWTGTARVNKDHLPNSPRRLNATAIHGSKDARKYLSWNRLPGNEPDFHQPGSSRPLQFLGGTDGPQH